MAVGHFEAVWPGRFREGEIGWRFFWMLYRMIPMKLALDRVTMTRATSIGFSGNDAAQREATKDIKEAFPD